MQYEWSHHFDLKILFDLLRGISTFESPFYSNNYAFFKKMFNIGFVQHLYKLFSEHHYTRFLTLFLYICLSILFSLSFAHKVCLLLLHGCQYNCTTVEKPYQNTETGRLSRLSMQWFKRKYVSLWRVLQETFKTRWYSQLLVYCLGDWIQKILLSLPATLWSTH